MKRTLLIVIVSLFWSRFAVAETRVCLPEDDQTCVVLSAQALSEIQQNPEYAGDIQIELHRTTGQEVQQTLRALQLKAYRRSDHQEIPHFAFHQPVTLHLGAWYLFQREIPDAAAGLSSNIPFSRVQDVRQYLGVYWFNGQHLIRLEGITLDADQHVNLPVHNLGAYQVKLVRQASMLEFAAGSPYPRVLTPLARNNRKLFFFVTLPGSGALTGTIYDALGGRVRGLQVDGSSPAANALVWDGRDDHGNVVPAGPYYYRVEADGQSLTGSVVVAR